MAQNEFLQKPQPSEKGMASRAKALLSASIERHLKTYAAAAAGIGLLAVAGPAAAQVVYTPAKIDFTNGDLFLDLNCGPSIQFWVADVLETSTYGGTREFALNGSTYASVLEDSKGPAVLPKGATVGPGQNFVNAFQNERVMATAYHFVYYFSYNGVGGNWANAQNGYLGLKFNILGQAHYGWAEFSVKAQVDRRRVQHVDARLLGYAYESAPNVAITTGDKAGGGSSSSAGAPAAGTLSALALGAPKAGRCPDFEPHGSTRSKRMPR
ncbi:MAG TPA: hypothetical protein VFA68_19535 [Terriglobales bacterium]|nr:hypothetical protein [Terriglobales bacterium]